MQKMYHENMTSFELDISKCHVISTCHLILIYGCGIQVNALMKKLSFRTSCSCAFFTISKIPNKRSWVNLHLGTHQISWDIFMELVISIVGNVLISICMLQHTRNVNIDGFDWIWEIHHSSVLYNREIWNFLVKD